MFLNPFEPFDNTCGASSSSIWIYDTSFGGRSAGSMSGNKLTSMAPTLSLGPPLQSSTDLTTFTSPPQPSLTPTQPLVASPLGPHTLNLTANTLGLNNTAQTLNTLNSPGLSANTLGLGNTAQTLNTLNSPSLSANTLGLNTAQTLNTLSSPAQPGTLLNTPTQGLGSLSSPMQPGNPSPQPLLSSPQVTTIVSLPQSFCFSSQSQSSSPSVSQPPPLGVTLGFPMAGTGGLGSNTISLNSSTIPMNSSTISLDSYPTGSLSSNNISLNSYPAGVLSSNTISLNSSTIPLNTGSSLPQQFVQPLSVGQQPTLCASLPQNISFPLGSLFTVANASAASGGPYLSTALGQFPGLQSVIVGGQPSLLQGSVAGSGSTTQGGQVQTLGALAPQSLSFPVTSGPVLTELPDASLQSVPQGSSGLPPLQPDPGISLQPTGQQDPVSALPTPQDPGISLQPAQQCPDIAGPEQSSQQLSEGSIQSAQQNPDASLPPVQQNVDISMKQQTDTQSTQPESQPDVIVVEIQQGSRQSPESQTPVAAQLNESTATQSVLTEANSALNTADGKAVSSAESSQTQQQLPQSSPSLTVQSQTTTHQLLSGVNKKGMEPGNERIGGKKSDDRGNGKGAEPGDERIGGKKSDDRDNSKGAEPAGGAPMKDANKSDEQRGDGVVAETTSPHIKMEAEESEETTASQRQPSESRGVGQNTIPVPQEMVAEPSAIKTEADTDVSDNTLPQSRHSTSHTYTSQPSATHTLPQSSSRHSMSHTYQSQPSATHSLLATLKKEAMEEEELPLPDSTPGSEDSQDSYLLRHSPSPMASLRLTRADTTTITTTSAYARPRLDHAEGAVDVKHNPAASDAVAVDYDDSEFVWEDYLQETGASAVPPTAFKHVECSLESGFVKGMRVEVPNRSRPGTYWVAAVIMTCGPLMRLRYEGYEDDASHDFWCDLSTGEIHPVGWCAENGQLLAPPEGIEDKQEDWLAALKDIMKTAPAAPSYLLDKTTGTSPIDQLKQGMRLELQDSERPTQVWLARIMENVGGRLYLRLEGVDSGLADFWAFYLDERLHPVGWARSRGYTYAAPTVLAKQGLSQSEIQRVLDSALKEAKEQKLPADIFKDQAEIKEHKFRQGMKLEAVNPRSGNHIGPATVVEVLDSFYFLVEMDDLTVKEPAKKIRFSCHSASPNIFPIQWTVYKGIRLTAPQGWQKPDFSWTEYLNHCRAMAAPESCFQLDYEEHEFERGMKLECVNPESPNQICAATITKIVAHLMWVHLDSSTRIVASHVEHVASHNLFPVGWCESNGFQLRPPRRAGHHASSAASSQKRVAVVQPEMAEGTQVKEEDGKGRSYCPKIYFNHKCFSGPHLSKGRIAELPCSVGPGPIGLVMKEVLSMLISVAYKSSRVLREIQLDGPPNPSMSQQVLKAKYKNKSYRAVVEICRTTNQLDDFCRQVCIKLECCPNLISPHFVGDSCPEHCSQLTKTKYTYYYGKKKRKIGRPPGGHSNLENGPKKPTKRRKRRRLGMVVRKTHSNNGEEGEEEEEEEEEEEGDDRTSETSDTPTVDSSSSHTMTRLHDHKPHPVSAMSVISKRLKRKYTHHIPPPSEIRTRGAKLPRYSFERRTHKKILLSPAPSGVSGLRSKTLQAHQLHHKPQKFTRSHSPEKMRPQMRPQTLLTGGSRQNPHPHPGPSPLSSSTPSTPQSTISSAPFSLPPPCSPLALDKNPLHWSVAETAQFIKTTDCAHVAKLFRDQEIDGQALLLLTLPTVQEHLELKLGPAIKLCHEIERVKRAFYTRYDTPQPSAPF